MWRLIPRFCGRRALSDSRTVTVIQGDGASIPIFDELASVFESANVPLKLKFLKVSGTDACNRDKLNEVIEEVRKSGIALKGIWNTDYTQRDFSPNISLRKELDLWANVVKVKNYPAISSRQDINFTIVRQNTEGEYSNLEHETCPGIVEMFKVTTRHRCNQIAKFAFDLALEERRGHIFCIHKANIMKLGDGMFLEEVRQMSLKYPSVRMVPMIVDNCSMQLVQKPAQFSMILTTNLYGSIIVNISSGLIGSGSILAGANFSDDRKIAVFEPATRSSSYCDNEYTNPMAYLHSASEMLRHIGMLKEATKIENAMKIVITTDLAKTPDIGGTSTTQEFMKAIRRELETTLKDH